MDDYILESPVRLRYVFAPPTYYPHICTSIIDADTLTAYKLP